MNANPLLTLLVAILAVPIAASGPNLSPPSGDPWEIKALCVEWDPPNDPAVGICEPRPGWRVSIYVSVSLA